MLFRSNLVLVKEKSREARLRNCGQSSKFVLGKGKLLEIEKRVSTSSQEIERCDLVLRGIYS